MHSARILNEFPGENMSEKNRKSGHDVFISYSSKNKNVADAIVADLESHGIRCWYAPRGIMPGQEWATAISEAMAEASVFVLIYTEESNKSKQVMNEVAMAFKLEKTVVPFKLTDDLMNPELEYYLSRVHWLDALTPPLTDGIKALREHVAVILQKTEPAPISESASEDIGEDIAEIVKNAKTGERATSAQELYELLHTDDEYEPVRESRGNRSFIIIAAAAVLLLAVCAGGFFFIRNYNTKKSISQGETLFYSQYQGTEDNSASRKAFESVADKGKADVLYYLGSLSEREYDFEAARKYYEEGVEQGSALSYVGLGRLYSEGKGVAVDYARARELCEEAEAMGCVDAELILGRMVRGGQAGFNADGVMAVGCFEKAMTSERRDVRALSMYELGAGYQYGLAGIGTDYDLALEWYERARTEYPYYSGMIDRNIAGIYTAKMEKVSADDHYREALNYFKAAAEAGNADAMLGVANAYRFGEGVECDLQEAAVWYDKAANAGNAAGMIGLAELYRDGKGVERDAELSYRWYCTAADRGDSDAMIAIGDLYAGGLYGADSRENPDIASARAWYEKAAASGNGRAYRMLGRTYDADMEVAAGENPDPEKAMSYYMQAVEMGDAGAWNDIGDAYESGNTLSGAVDINEAKECYERASTVGDAEGMSNLADLYLLGKMGEADPETAVVWYQKAANAQNPNPHSELCLGVVYASDYLGKPNYVQAEYWFNRAAEHGEVSAYYLMGGFYCDGVFGGADYETAAAYFRQGAESGDPDCMHSLGFLYEKGLLTDGDSWLEARDWYEKASQAGDVEALTDLGRIYYGDGYLQTSFNCWKQAADAGNADAMVYTGCAYIAGEGTALNEIEAFGCFKEAADKGNACGMRMLSYCYENGIGTDEDIVQAEYWQKEAAGAGYGKDEAYEELQEHVEKFIEQ